MMRLKNRQNKWSGHFKLDLVDLQQKKNDGSLVDFKREVLNAPDSVVVLLYRLDNKQLVLTSQWRAPIVCRGDVYPMIEACAGNIDKKDIVDSDNDMMQAAIQTAYREVEEETGWHIAKLDFLYALYSCPGVSTEQLYYFIASVDERIHQGGGLADENEDIEVIEMSLNDAVKQIKSGKIKDLKTTNLIQYLQLHVKDYLL